MSENGADPRRCPPRHPARTSTVVGRALVITGVVVGWLSTLPSGPSVPCRPGEPCGYSLETAHRITAAGLTIATVLIVVGVVLLRRARWRFVPPPGWPPVWARWSPPRGWCAPDEFPAAPDGWRWWERKRGR